MKKIIPIIIAVMAVVGGGAFYGGMQYQSSKARNLSPDARRQMFQQQGGNVNGRTSGIRQGGNGLTMGEIIAKDDISITIKLRDGGSKIIFVSDATEITKSTKGTLGDLEVGKAISVGGKQNTDGSITAETVQLRPNSPIIPQL